MFIDGVFNVMFYVWALVFSSLTQFALNIKLASLERVGVSSNWKNAWNNCRFDLFFSEYEPNSSFLRFLYSGHSVIKCISSSTLLTRWRQKRSSAGIGIGRNNLPFTISKLCALIRSSVMAFIKLGLRLILRYGSYLYSCLICLYVRNLLPVVFDFPITLFSSVKKKIS